MRLLVHDDEDQCRRAEVVWRRAVAAGGDYVILFAASDARAATLWTFDEQLAGVTGASAIP